MDDGKVLRKMEIGRKVLTTKKGPILPKVDDIARTTFPGQKTAQFEEDVKNALICCHATYKDEKNPLGNSNFHY